MSSTILYCHSLGDCGSSKLDLSVRLSNWVSVWLLQFISQLLWVGFWWNLIEVSEVEHSKLKSKFVLGKLFLRIMILLQFVCLCVCLCECPSVCLWTKFQPKGCTDLDAVFAKWLLLALARILLNLVTLGQRSRSQWRDIHFFFIIFCWFPNCRSQLSYVWSNWNIVCSLI